MAEVVCPVCSHAENLVYHASYRKYYYNEHIVVVRVMCTNCRVTHALIPSFSLPGTSIGTAEAESYLHERDRGASMMSAGSCFFRAGYERAISGFLRENDHTLHREHEGRTSHGRRYESIRNRIFRKPDKECDCTG